MDFSTLIDQMYRVLLGQMKVEDVILDEAAISKRYVDHGPEVTYSLLTHYKVQQRPRNNPKFRNLRIATDFGGRLQG
jgi:hypothetical protein